MHRRTVLIGTGGALAGALAGCTSSTDGSEPPAPPDNASTTPTATSTRSTEGTRQRTVALESQDEVPDSHRVSIDLEVLEPAITTAHTARIRLTVTNEGPARSLSVGADNCNLFNRDYAGSDDPAGLWLYQPEQTEYLDRKGEQWVPDRPQSEPRAYPMYGCLPRSYESGESVHTEYVVWDDYRVDGYLQPTTYRWEEEIEIWEERNARDTDQPSATFTWGFSLSIEKAN